MVSSTKKSGRILGCLILHMTFNAIFYCCTSMKAQSRSLVGVMPVSDSFVELSLAEGLLQVIDLCLADSGGGGSAQQQK